MAPWASFLMKKAFNLSDEVVPRFSLTPQISLIPRWFVQDMIHKANRISFFGIDGWGDAIYPEASWHDYIVERQILEDALVQIREGNMSPAQVDKLRADVSNAIKTKDTELWQQSYKNVTNDEAYRNWGSFFTGIYAKPFTDGQAELLKVRNDINLLKSAMNNEFQTEIFGLPDGAEDAYQNYINKLDTDDGWVVRMYTDIGWVKNDLGQEPSDPKERTKWLAIQIEKDEKQALYYQRSAEIQKEYNERLRAMPIGSTYEQMLPIYEWYHTQRDNISYLSSPRSTYMTNKPVELIQKQLTDEWFRAINSSKPSWDVEGGETYDEYTGRVAQWQAQLPQSSGLYMGAFMRQKHVVELLNALREDQQFDKSFFGGLAQQTTAQGIEEWETQNDDIFDALNKAWKATYWEEYWNSGVLQKGYSSDLAEQDFLAKHPTPPSADELWAWVSE